LKNTGDFLNDLAGNEPITLLLHTFWFGILDLAQNLSKDLLKQQHMVFIII
jgi:hypothetical protein